MITIEKEPFNYEKCYGGTYRVNGEELKFTIFDSYDANSDSNTVEVNWVELLPENHLEIEEKIKEKFSLIYD